MRAVRATLRIAAHELRGYVRAPAAWGIATLFLAVQGIGFAGQLAALSDPARPARLGAVLEGFFAGSLLTWSLGMAVLALIAMRALAEDRRAGTWETLLTAPVGEAEAVIGKWLAGAAFHAALWAPTVLYLAVVALYRPAGASWDLGPVLGAYLGVVALGAALLAIAFAAASTSAEPLIAGGIAYAALMLVFLIGEVPTFAPGLATDHPTLAAIVDALAVRARLGEFARGEITGASIILVVGLIAVGLSLAITGACAGRRRRREIGVRALATVLVAVIAIQLGAAARRWPVALDLTSRGANSLEPATREALAAIDGPIGLTIVRPTLAVIEPVFVEAERVARRIAAVRAGVTVRVLDPVTTGVGDIAREAGLDAKDLAGSGAVVVAVGDRRRVIDLVDLASFAATPVPAPLPPGAKPPAPTVTRLSIESEIVVRLRELADPRPVVACMTTEHGELAVAPDPAFAEIFPPWPSASAATAGASSRSARWRSACPPDAR